MDTSLILARLKMCVEWFQRNAWLGLIIGFFLLFIGTNVDGQTKSGGGFCVIFAIVIIFYSLYCIGFM